MAKLTILKCDRCGKTLDDDAVLTRFEFVVGDSSSGTPSGPKSYAATGEVCDACAEQLVKIGKQRITLEEKASGRKKAAATPGAEA